VLHLAHKIIGAPIHATDGPIGTVEDFYFDEDRWTVRYLLIDTGRWLSGRRVLLSPMSIRGEWHRGEIPVALTKDQVWHSPEIDFQSALSRGVEAQILGYYGYPAYWGEQGVWGTFDNPAALLAAPPARSQAGDDAVDVEAQHLRGTREITGYHLHATDGEIGHVDDVLIGQESWRIRYLLVDTSNWIGGRSVVVSVPAVERIEAYRKTVEVALSRDEVKNGQSFASIEEAVGIGEVGPPFAII
jgi:uncharacterized protein YrrD